MSKPDQKEINEILEELKDQIKLKTESKTKLLWRLQDADEIHNDSVILEMLETEKVSLRVEIIQVLAKSKSKLAERAFIKILNTSQKYYELYWSIIGLRNCGTTECIPVLKEYLYHPKTDIKLISLGAIESIVGSSQDRLYFELLIDKNYPEKTIATRFVCRHCGDYAIDVVVARLRKVLGRKPKRIKSNPKDTELTLIMDYLNPYALDHQSISKVFANVEKKWELLPDFEKQHLLKNIPYFEHKER